MPSYQAPDNVLENRIILVTGAGSGLGRSIALGYASYGATVILLDKNVKNIEAVYDEIEKQGFPQAALYPLDLEGATADNYIELSETIDKEFGRLDGLVHNAAVYGTITPVQLYDAESWFKVLQTNLNGPFLLTQNCISLLNASEDGRILFVTDACANQGSAYWGAYGVAKAGMQNLMQILADELESNTEIRVNSIDPGNVRTKSRALIYPGEDPKSIPEPDEILPGFVFLIGPDSKPYNGQLFQAEDFI